MAAMRAIWKGHLALAAVGLAVKLYTATDEKGIAFHQVHRRDGGQIKMQRICSEDGAEVPFKEIAKGYDLGDGDMVVLDDQDFADLPVASSRVVDVLEFVPAEQVDPTLFDKAYYLAPDGAASLKPYLLLRESLSASGKIGIAKVAIRQRERLAALRVRDGVLVLTVLLWPDELREPDFDFLHGKTALRPQEQQMAATLVDSMAGDFHPQEHTDTYREALQELVAAKVEGRAPTPAGPEKPTKAADLLSVLTASVERLREGQPAGRGAKQTGTKKSISKAPAGGAAAKEKAGKKAAEPAKKSANKAAEQPAKKLAKTTAKKEGAKKEGAKKEGAKKPAKAARKAA